MKTRRPRVLLKYFAVISTICIFVLLLLLGFISLVDRARQIEWPWEVAVLSDPTVIPTNHYPMRVTAIRAPGTRWGGAGAIDAVGNQIFLATRSGGFFRYVRGKSGFERLEIPSPTNITALVKNFKENKFRTSFGLKDMLISDQSGKTTIYATYHIWKEAQKCYALRLSRYDFSGMGEVESKSKSSEWETLFETQPCVSAGQSNYPLEAGGRLSFLEDNILLMTVGDHDFKRSSFVQAVDTSYGKIWKINVRSGHSEIFSIGHRNPQGLFVSASGVIWETEHGPKGGDELNIIKKGANYGWPLRTYGTAYGKYI